MTEECPLCGIQLETEMKGDVGAYIVCSGCVGVAQEMKELLVQTISKISNQGVGLPGGQVNPMAFTAVTMKMNVQFKVVEEATVRMTEFGRT